MERIIAKVELSEPTTVEFGDMPCSFRVMELKIVDQVVCLSFTFAPLLHLFKDWMTLGGGALQQRARCDLRLPLGLRTLAIYGVYPIRIDGDTVHFGLSQWTFQPINLRVQL
jgi:hypothetical protein